MNQRPLVIAVVGPTASGKTAISIELARKFNGEVICCDSRTIYKYMDIGTAKPTPVERQGVPHHMIDVVEPSRVYTVAEFQREGTVALNDILQRRKMPIVCGGTGFYARALLQGLVIPEVPPQEELRHSLKKVAEEEGNDKLHKRLMELDPESARKIMVNDRFRIIRALEVTLVAGRPFSQVAQRTDVPFDVVWLGLNFENRDVLKKRIRERLDEQLRQGLVEEAQYLLGRFGPTQPLLNAVTYRQMIKYLQDIWTLEEAVEDCIKHNYQLARKQIMWFRSNPETRWFLVDKSEDLQSDVIAYLDSSV